MYNVINFAKCTIYLNLYFIDFANYNNLFFLIHDIKGTSYKY